MPESNFHFVDRASLSRVYCEFRDRKHERRFLHSRQSMGTRKLRFAALTVLFAVGPLELVDYLNVGWSMELLLLTVTRVVMVSLAVAVLLITYGRLRFHYFSLIMSLLGCSILLQVIINSMMYVEKTESVVLQMVLISIFGLIFYPGRLRIIFPLVAGFNAIFFANIWFVAGLHDPEIVRMLIWRRIALTLGLYTSRQLNRAASRNCLKLRRRGPAGRAGPRTARRARGPAVWLVDQFTSSAAAFGHRPGRTSGIASHHGTA